jgi:hypothetical protein
MATFNHVSSSVRLVLNAGTSAGKAVTKNVGLLNIRGDIAADSIGLVAAKVGELLEYPVTETRKYDVSLLNG